MTLKEKFTNAIVLPFEYEKKIQESLIIADEFAIGFAMFISTHCYCELGSDTRSYQELLEIYKKEKGL
jgi:hypothetical protein